MQILGWMVQISELLLWKKTHKKQKQNKKKVNKHDVWCVYAQIRTAHM